MTYSLLVVGAKGWGARAAKKADGTELEGSLDKTSRLAQIIEWLEEGDGDPIIVLDECHKAKNLLASKSGAGAPVCLRACVHVYVRACVRVCAIEGERLREQ